MTVQPSLEKLPIVLIGAGFWGASWAKLVMDSPWTSLVGLVGRNPDRLRAVARDIQLPEDQTFSCLEDVLALGEARAALVVVPPEAHRSVTVEALEAGLHCLVEKPFAPSLADAREIVALAAQRERLVMVGQNYRFRRGPATVRRLLEQGAIGRVQSVHGRLVKQLHLDLEGWRSQMREPIIVDQAVHHFDFIRSVFGIEPRQVRAHSFNPSWSWFDGNACAAVEFRTDDCYISYFGSWVAQGSLDTTTSFEGSWELQGERGCITWEHNRIRLTPTDLGDLIFYPGGLEREGGVVEIPLLKLAVEERSGVLAEFAQSVSAGREPEASGRDNLQTLAMVFAAETAARADGWVEIAGS